jgi:hypothetical protein
MKEFHASPGDDPRIIGQLRMSTRYQRIRQRHAKLTREMVVAGAGFPERSITRSDCESFSRGLQIGRDLHDAFQHVRDSRRREPVIAVPPLPFDA